MGDLENFGSESGGLRLDDRSPMSSLPLQTLGLRFHHVSVVVRNIDDALEYYLGLFGFERVAASVDVDSEQMRICFVRAEPGVIIGLVEETGVPSLVDGNLELTEAGTSHICYQVDDLDAAIRVLVRNRCSVQKRYQMPIQELRDFALMLAPDGQLFELCEAESNEEVSS